LHTPPFKEKSAILLFSRSSCQKRTCSVAAPDSKNKLKP